MQTLRFWGESARKILDADNDLKSANTNAKKKAGVRRSAEAFFQELRRFECGTHMAK
jgi:hypothetical protein